MDTRKGKRGEYLSPQARIYSISCRKMLCASGEGSFTTTSVELDDGGDV